MKRALTFIVALAVAVILAVPAAQAQQVNRNAAQNRAATYPTYPMYPGMGYGYGGWGYPGWGWGGSTVAGDFLLGSGYAAMGTGQMILDSSLAAINYEQAYDQWIGSQKKAQATLFDMRRANASYRAELEFQRPHPTASQIMQFNKSRLPKPLSHEEWQPDSQLFLWPTVLAGDQFATERATIERLFAERAKDPVHTAYGTTSYRELRTAVQEMSDHLNGMINRLDTDEFMQAHKFLQSLAYEVRKEPLNILARSGGSPRK